MTGTNEAEAPRGGAGGGAYLLQSDAEGDRLRLQARVWEPAAEALFDAVDVRPGWACADLGCGAMGVLGPLARRVGPRGRVVGVERDPALAAAARAYVRATGLANAEVVEGDALTAGLPAGGFDLVHARFVLPHVPDPEAFLLGMRALARPGGAVVVQEPDHHSWHFYPPCPAWPRLLAILEAAFALRGDINIGRRAFGLLRGLGLEGVTARAALLALHDGHPYMRMPLVALGALRAPILAARLAGAAELDALAAEVEQHAAGPDTLQLTFTVVQVWGRRPAGGPG